jgi:hypothetical protein
MRETSTGCGSGRIRIVMVAELRSMRSIRSKGDDPREIENRNTLGSLLDVNLSVLLLGSVILISEWLWLWLWFSSNLW